VVVDVGSRLDLTDTALFKRCLHHLPGHPGRHSELRNSNRLISQFFNVGSPKLEIVINRYEPRALGVSDETITKALTRPAHLEDSQRLRGGAADAEHRHPAGPGRFADFAPDQANGHSICGSARGNPKKKGFRLFG
jgi:hypothetical protein